MDFIPHTPDDDRAMLEAIGLGSLDELFETIPEGVRLDRPLDLPPELSEVELARHMAELAGASQDATRLVCFAGGGAYDHHVPAAVRALAGRAEFATSYTPYQPELSQGVLQAVYEFQTLVCEIYGMEVANASLYDGASALVEGVNLAVRATGRHKAVVGAGVHPHYLEVLRTYTSGLEIDIVVAPFGPDGVTDWSAVDLEGAAAVVCAYPNFFGRLEDLAASAAAAHDHGALSVAVVDPTAMGVLASPGDAGADIAVGEGHALGNALFYGGPYVGLFATKLELVRQVPGRIAGETLDADGRRAFVLTLQAREQHIRRAKATSNVCTNQTLMAIAAGIHLSWLGPKGLERLGEICVRRAAYAAARLGDIPGCSVRFAGAHFKEVVIETPVAADVLARGLARRGFLAGPALGRWFPELSSCLLIAVTEKRTADEINALAEAIEKELAEA
ncbi:MAG TPA: aminomethyl-transferring glycine dehydrogenase subunit GcvPA [Actinomycetota bacterium]|jgi:glycine dehydrogenase subunit 1